MALKPPRMIDAPHRKWSVWVLSAATALAGLEQALPALKGVMPPDWYAYAFGAALLARLIRQTVDDAQKGQ